MSKLWPFVAIAVLSTALVKALYQSGAEKLTGMRTPRPAR